MVASFAPPVPNTSSSLAKSSNQNSADTQKSGGRVSSTISRIDEEGLAGSSNGSSNVKSR